MFQQSRIDATTTPSTQSNMDGHVYKPPPKWFTQRYVWPFFRLTPSVAGSISDKSQPFGARLLYATKLTHQRRVGNAGPCTKSWVPTTRPFHVRAVHITPIGISYLGGQEHILLRYISRSTMLSSGRHCDDPMPLGALSGETRRVYGWD